MVTEDSQKDIEEKLRDAEQAAEPGKSLGERITFPVDVGLPPARVEVMESAGWTYVYDTKTGDRSLANRNMLRQLLQRKRPDGSLVFSTVPPRDKGGKIITPKRGTYKCMLHPDDPNRKHYDDMGFRVCLKSNLTSLFQVKQHMRKRHPQEWEAIEDEKKTAEASRERQLRETLLEKAIGPEETFTCDICGKQFSSKIALTGHMRSHK